MIVAAIQVVVLLAVGRIGFGVHLPSDLGAFVLAVVVGMISFSALGLAMSTLVPNQDAAGPIVSIVFFVLLFLSGLWFPLKPGSGLAQFSSFFPVHRFISAVFAPFDVQKGASPWAWHDLLVVALWGVAGAIVAVRRWRWAPRRN
jgi:ABC-2 type transport system permease protein